MATYKLLVVTIFYLNTIQYSRPTL